MAMIAADVALHCLEDAVRGDPDIAPATNHAVADRPSRRPCGGNERREGVAHVPIASTLLGTAADWVLEYVLT
jgi:hypothetical protein